MTIAVRFYQRKIALKIIRLADYTKEQILKIREDDIEKLYESHGKEKVESGFYNS